MIPQNQTRPHPNGDCTRACIASLLDTPIAEVPDWLAMTDGAEDIAGYPAWWLKMQDWLRLRGLAFLEVQLERKTWMPLPFPCFAIFIGPDPTGNRHAIVGQCIDGKFIPMHDPMGGDPAQAFVNGRVEGVCFLVPLDPSATRFKSADVRQALRRARNEQINGSPQARD